MVELGDDCGFERVLEVEGNDLGLRVESLSLKHGSITVNDERLLDRLCVGVRLRVLASRSCLTAAQHSHYHVLKAGRLLTAGRSGEGVEDRSNTPTQF